MGHNLIDIDPCSKAPPLPTHHVQTHIANQPRQICQRILQFCERNSKSEDSQIHFLRQVSPADFAPHHAPHDIRDRRLHVRQSPGERVARGSGLGARGDSPPARSSFWGSGFGNMIGLLTTRTFESKSRRRGFANKAASLAIHHNHHAILNRFASTDGRSLRPKLLASHDTVTPPSGKQGPCSRPTQTTDPRMPVSQHLRHRKAAQLDR
jgi:hypothetical protein